MSSFKLKRAAVLAFLWTHATASPYENQTQTYGCNTAKYYDIDWAKVYVLDQKVPQGCECAKSGVSEASCDVFDCNCGCDLNAGSCDMNCCCDPDCSAAQVARFEATELGCFSQAGQPGFEACYNAEAVNGRYDMKYTGTSKQVLDELLCVSASNAAIRGSFFAQPETFTSVVFDSSDGQKDFSYTKDRSGLSSALSSSTVRGSPVA